MNADGARRFRGRIKDFKTGSVVVRISDNKPSRETVMSGKKSRMARFASAAACAVLLSAGSAFASQGPGTGPGTAGALTQLTMAILVYGASALIVGAGLIGALRRRLTSPRPLRGEVVSHRQMRNG
jgi:hypothetical protein